MAKPVEGMRCSLVGRLGGKPAYSRTMAGGFVCRLLIVEEAAGPASSPVTAAAYITGELAKRCAFKLNEGDLVSVEGKLGSRLRGARYPEVVVLDDAESVRLFERAGAEAVATA